jgi:thiosulfate reductase cytochrome b subunit
MSELETDIKYIRRDLDKIMDRLDNNFVKREEFVPVQRLVYGVVGLILTSVIVALIALVLRTA